jgi:hypothetical protein
VKSHAIPNAALDDRLGWMGTAGSGKTYKSSEAIERVLDRRGRVIIQSPWAYGGALDCLLTASPPVVVPRARQAGRSEVAPLAHEPAAVGPARIADGLEVVLIARDIFGGEGAFSDGDNDDAAAALIAARDREVPLAGHKVMIARRSRPRNVRPPAAAFDAS